MSRKTVTWINILLFYFAESKYSADGEREITYIDCR